MAARRDRLGLGSLAALALLHACSAAPPPTRPHETATGATRPSTATNGPKEVREQATRAEVAAAPPIEADVAPAAAPAGPRLTSVAQGSWIRPRPRTKDQFLGYVRTGSSVALRSTELVRGDGCKGGFYQVEPRGFVCNDATVTLEPAARFVEASAATAGSAGPLPYRYAISNGAPMYNRVPTRDEQDRRERKFGPAGKFLKQPKTLSSHEELAVLPPATPTDPVPPFFADGKAASPSRLGLIRQDIPLGAMLSFTRAFEAQGRTWLLSPDMTLVPADRARVFVPSTFRGVKLSDETRLPLAWVRKEPRRKHVKTATGAIEPTAATWDKRALVRLSGAEIEQDGKRWLETHETTHEGARLYVGAHEAHVVDKAPKRPFGVKPGQKWVVISITQGTLVAYEDETPVYATLISPGKGGVPIPGKDPVEMATTPLGTYYVTFKDRAATMAPEDPDRKLWIADVPHTQYFDPPFALHAAYWHDRFGEPTSAGCVNLSPIDAEALFHWSDPPVPDGWQGATGAGAKENGPTTAVIVRR